MKRLLFACAMLPVISLSATVQAQWPEKPVRFIVPFPAGGAADALPRLTGEKLSQKWGRTIVVENRPGAGGGIATTAVARAEPDGYTLLTTPAGPIVTNGIMQKLNYDPLAFEPVIILGTAPIVLSVRPSPQFSDAKSFIAYAKANSGKLNYGTQGPGSNSHLSALAFAHAIGAQMTAVPYGGSAPALNDLMSGNIDLFFDNMGSSLPLHTAGRIRILAVATNQRNSKLEGVPTLIESGVEGYLSFTWFGVFAPPGTPPALAARINRDFAEVLAMPDIRSRFDAIGITPGSGSPADVRALVISEKAKWEGVAKRAGVTPKQ